MRFLVMMAIAIAIYVITQSIWYAALTLILLMLAPFILAALFGLAMVLFGALLMLGAFIVGCGVAGFRAVTPDRKRVG